MRSLFRPRVYDFARSVTRPCHFQGYVQNNFQKLVTFISYFRPTTDPVSLEMDKLTLRLLTFIPICESQRRLIKSYQMVDFSSTHGMLYNTFDSTYQNNGRKRCHIVLNCKSPANPRHCSHEFHMAAGCTLSARLISAPGVSYRQRSLLFVFYMYS